MNWLVFDRDYNFITGGYQRMSTSAKEYGQDVAHEKLSGQLVATQPGYVYIYLSNEETTPVDVFFDDFKVTQVKSPVVQSDDYYPFGLAFNSYQRENSLLNLYKYNGKEEQTELDLGWLDFGARMCIPELGRFFTPDRFTEIYSSLTPYHYGGNNPVLFVDFNGDSLITAFSDIYAMLAFARQTLEGLDGGGFKLNFASTGEKNENGDDYYNVTLEGGDPDKLSTGARSFYSGLKGVIDSDEAVKINVVYGDKNTATGNYKNNTIDMADIEKWPSFDHTRDEQKGPTTSGKLIHEIREQFNKKLYGVPKGSMDKFGPSHGDSHYSGSALYWEDSVNGNSRRPDASANPGEGVIQQFKLKNGTVVKYRVMGSGVNDTKRPVIIVVPYNGSRGIK